MKGSLKKGFTATRLWLVEEMLTTAGDTLASIGASEGSCCPSTATGRVPAAAGSAAAARAIRTAATRPCGLKKMRDGDDMTVPRDLKPTPIIGQLRAGRAALARGHSGKPVRSRNFFRRTLYRPCRWA